MTVMMAATMVEGRPVDPPLGVAVGVMSAGSTMPMAVGEKTLPLRPRIWPGVGFWAQPASRAVRSATGSVEGYGLAMPGLTHSWRDTASLHPPQCTTSID